MAYTMGRRFILGIDQGSTKTDVIIADDAGNIEGIGNDRDWIPIIGERRAVRMIRIRYAADKAAAEAGLKLEDIERVSACCTGADWEFEYEVGRKNIRNTLGIGQVSLYNDCIGALRGGTVTKGRDTAVICLGSGANCAAINREGQEYIFAFYLKHIHQGATAIGRFIFEAVYDAEAGLGKETMLTKLLLEETGYQSVDELHMSVTTGRTETEKPWVPEYKNYSPLLFQAVNAGDEVAKNYLEWFCNAIARYVIVAVEKLGMKEREVTLVLSGGVPKSGSIMIDLLQKRLKEDLPEINCIHARLEPVVGALLLEYDRLYPEGIPEEVIKRLEQCCGKYNLFRSFSTD